MLVFEPHTAAPSFSDYRPFIRYSMAMDKYSLDVTERLTTVSDIVRGAAHQTVMHAHCAAWVTVCQCHCRQASCPTDSPLRLCISAGIIELA